MLPRKHPSLSLAVSLREAAELGLIPSLKLSIDTTLKILELFQRMKDTEAERALVTDIVASMEAFYNSYRNLSGRADWSLHGFNLLVDNLTSILREIEISIVEQLHRSRISRLFANSTDSTKTKVFRDRLQAVVNKLENLDHVAECVNTALHASLGTIQPRRVPTISEELVGPSSSSQTTSGFSSSAPSNSENLPDDLQEHIRTALLLQQSLTMGAYVDSAFGRTQTPSNTPLPAHVASPFYFQYQTPSTIPIQPPYYQNPSPMIVIVHNHHSPVPPCMPPPPPPPITINNKLSNIGNSNDTTYIK